MINEVVSFDAKWQRKIVARIVKLFIVRVSQEFFLLFDPSLVVELLTRFVVDEIAGKDTESVILQDKVILVYAYNLGTVSGNVFQ